MSAQRNLVDPPETHVTKRVCPHTRMSSPCLCISPKTCDHPAWHFAAAAVTVVYSLYPGERETNGPPRKKGRTSSQLRASGVQNRTPAHKTSFHGCSLAPRIAACNKTECGGSRDFFEFGREESHCISETNKCQTLDNTVAAQTEKKTLNLPHSTATPKSCVDVRTERW